MTTLGIDISKETFDATLVDENGELHHRAFKNSAKGFKQLKRWLKKRKVREMHACMEATNIYWEDLAQFLYDSGFWVSVVNPARIKGFAMSQLRRNKSDKLDSLVIAQFCLRMTPKLWTPPTEDEKKLRSLVRHRQALKKTLVQQKNRLASCRDQTVRASLKRLIEQIEAEIKSLEKQTQAHIDAHSELKEKQVLLKSIKGIGNATAALLMAEMYDLAKYKDARSAAADAGLTPSHYSSGTSVRRRTKVSKIGKKSIRGGLYWPAITAIRDNPIIRALAVRLEKRGKHNMAIITAAMRKLVHIAYGVLKNKTPFDPNYAN